MAKKNKKASNSDLDFMDKLWEAANRLRGSMDAAEYKHVVLGLIFLKYVSDMFEFRKNGSRRQSEIRTILNTISKMQLKKN